MNILDLIQGFIIGGSLIIAIGPQNLFVIQQGLKNNYVLIIVLICSFSDALLIIIGIFLSSIIININPFSINILKFIGGFWLIIYGLKKVITSKKNNIKNKENLINDKLLIVVLNTLIITYANPHVYIDTVILLGTLSTNFQNQFLFGLGAILASFIFFFFLGYTSKWLSKYIISNKLWFWIDNIIGIVMISYGIYFIIN